MRFLRFTFLQSYFLTINKNKKKALTLINMRDITAAKKLLNEIIKKEGFYKDKADVKLKGL